MVIEKCMIRTLKHRALAGKTAKKNQKCERKTLGMSNSLLTTGSGRACDLSIYWHLIKRKNCKFECVGHECISFWKWNISNFPVAHTQTSENVAFVDDSNWKKFQCVFAFCWWTNKQHKSAFRVSFNGKHTHKLNATLETGKDWTGIAHRVNNHLKQLQKLFLAALQIGYKMYQMPNRTQFLARLLFRLCVCVRVCVSFRFVLCGRKNELF